MKGHPDYFCDDIDRSVEICRLVGSERVKVLFDIYHVQIMHGDLVRRVRTGSPHVVLIDGSALPRGGAAAKNAGVRAARHQRIAFCDADDVVRDGWVASMRAALEDNPVVTCDREYRSLNPLHPLSFQPPRDRRGRYRVLGVMGVSGGAFGIDRDLYLSLGGFDETIRGAVDTEFAIRLADAGYRPVHEDRAVVSVRLPVTVGSSFRRAHALSRSTVEIARLHSRPLGFSTRSLFFSFRALVKPVRFWHLEQRLIWATNAGTWIGRTHALRYRLEGR